MLVGEKKNVTQQRGGGGGLKMALHGQVRINHYNCLHFWAEFISFQTR